MRHPLTLHTFCPPPRASPSIFLHNGQSLESLKDITHNGISQLSSCPDTGSLPAPSFLLHTLIGCASQSYSHCINMSSSYTGQSSINRYRHIIASHTQKREEEPEPEDNHQYMPRHSHQLQQTAPPQCIRLTRQPSSMLSSVTAQRIQKSFSISSHPISTCSLLSQPQQLPGYMSHFHCSLQ